MESPPRHLNPEELDWLSENAESPSTAVASEQFEFAKRHLIECERCRGLVRDHSDIRAELGRIATTGSTVSRADCPAPDRWPKLLAGLLGEEDARDLLDHSAQCDACGSHVRQLAEDFANELTEDEKAILGSLKSSEPNWQRSTAQHLSSLAKQQVGEPVAPRGWWDRAWVPLRYAYAIGVAVVLATVGLWLYRVREVSSPEKLLAQAYADQRTVELRIDGAKYAPLRQERGAAQSVLKKPSALLRAELQISEELANRPEDGRVLAAKGRAELLEWQYEEAIKSLKHALDLGGESASVLCDLASAYVERGDVENRPTDYGEALEFLGRALQKEPQNTVALFNRAIVDERLNLVEEAKKHWEDYLRVEPHDEWAQEARERLEALRRKTKEQSSLESPETDASRAIRVLETRVGAMPPGSRAWPDSLDEEYMELAVMDWLPGLASKVATNRTLVLETDEGRALEVLARVLVSSHGDRWLADLLAAPLSPQVLAGWRELGRAVRSNSEGDFDVAALAAERAETLLGEQCRPGFLLALWEQAYARQRAQQGKLCMRALERAGETAVSIAYPWVAAQFHLEHAICSGMLGEMGETRRDALAAVSIAESSGYGSLALRSYHIAGVQSSSQDPEQAWMWFAKGLQRHWGGAYRPFRAYQFYAEMSFAPENSRQWHLARTLMEEAVVHIGRTPNGVMEAMARHSLAVDAQMAGDRNEALREFRQAATIFASLSPTPSVKALQFSAEVYQASLLSEEGEDDSALETLRTARFHFSAQSQYWVWLHYYETLGRILLHRGDREGAERALHAAVYVSESALSTIASETDRIFWERQTGRAYRALVELEYDGTNGPEKALDLWQWYVAAPVRTPQAAARQVAIDFTRLESDPPLPRLKPVAAHLSELKQATVVSFAELDGELFAWLLDDRGIQGRRLNVGAQELEGGVRRFIRLCSDPSSNLTGIRRLGGQLYGWLLSPFESLLDPARTLIVETDGELSELPFAALVTSQGRFLGETFGVLNSPGLGYWPEMRAVREFSPRDRVLAVGISMGSAEFRNPLPSLADSVGEAESVASSFVHSRLLVGNEATTDAIRRDLPGVRVFHFAGHGIGRATRAGLLVASARDGVVRLKSGDGFLDAAEIGRLPWGTVGLVVLSACATDDENAPEAPQGLVRELFEAGVPDVIASRWNVDSRTTRTMMAEFYRRLTAGRSVAGALQSASNVIRQHAETAHPYYWASFSAFGRD